MSQLSEIIKRLQWAGQKTETKNAYIYMAHNPVGK